MILTAASATCCGCSRGKKPKEVDELLKKKNERQRKNMLPKTGCSVPTKMRNKPKSSPFTTPVHTVLWVSATAMRQEKKIKGMKRGKKVKMSLFADDSTNLYIRDSRGITSWSTLSAKRQVTKLTWWPSYMPRHTDWKTNQETIIFIVNSE